jgi:hypothetical protein
MRVTQRAGGRGVHATRVDGGIFFITTTLYVRALHPFLRAPTQHALQAGIAATSVSSYGKHTFFVLRSGFYTGPFSPHLPALRQRSRRGFRGDAFYGFFLLMCRIEASPRVPRQICTCCWAALATVTATIFVQHTGGESEKLTADSVWTGIDRGSSMAQTVRAASPTTSLRHWYIPSPPRVASTSLLGTKAE